MIRLLNRPVQWCPHRHRQSPEKQRADHDLMFATEPARATRAAYGSVSAIRWAGPTTRAQANRHGVPPMSISPTSYPLTSSAANRWVNANRLAMTREQTRRKLMEHAQAASTLIADCFVYIDTVVVLLPKPLEWSRLRETNCSKIIPYRSKVRHLPYGYRIHQPSWRTIEYISRERPNHLVSRFDPALDFIVTSVQSQLLLDNFLWQHLTQPWRGKRERTVYEGTVYFGPKVAGIPSTTCQPRRSPANPLCI
jgi:hypothetical protein